VTDLSFKFFHPQNYVKKLYISMLLFTVERYGIMSRFKLELCSCVVRDNYGELVEKVAMFIAKNGPSQLKTAIKRTGCSVKQVSSFYRSGLVAVVPLTLSGLFASENFRFQERKVHMKNFHSLELSFPGTFTPSDSDSDK